jgi:hypothetical protein
MSSRECPSSSSQTSADETLHGSSFSFEDGKFKKEGKPEEEFDLDEFPQRLESASERSPPNGGLLAWLQVFGAFFLFMNSWYSSLPPLSSPHLSPLTQCNGVS